MASVDLITVNSVVLVGKATRDPETRPFGQGGKVAFFGLCVNERVQKDGQWVDAPTFIDVKAFGAAADRVLDKVKKGRVVEVQGRLKQENWDDKNGGGKRSKIVLIANRTTTYETSRQQQNGQGQQRTAPPDDPYTPDDPGAGGGDEGIPF
jgi:single-strand DNA-binding protein